MTPASGQPHDPAAWGTNHAGQPLPGFLDGEECLFCHRNPIGSRWQQNRHAQTIQQDEPEAPDAARQNLFLLGAGAHRRMLRRLRPGVFAIEEGGEFNAAHFQEKCAGCHTSGFDTTTNEFLGVGIDCFACHGAVTHEHATDTSLVWLSKKKRDDSRVILSLCAQCHLRGGRSRSTGRPYANNFIAGDNLFQDFEVDLSLASSPSLSPADRHIYADARALAVEGLEKPNCLHCHDIHGNSTQKHRRVPRSEICYVCHDRGETLTKPAAYEVHSATCEY